MTRRRRHECAGFTLIDLLVSVAVMVVLISILLPSLSAARESAKRVVCASNVRQVGYAMQMYASENKGALPRSIFYSGTSSAELSAVQETMVLRLDGSERGAPGMPTGVLWDGLGLLIRHEYLSHPGSLFCPSHHGEHTFDVYAEAINRVTGSVFGNYQYRSIVDNRTILAQISPSASLIADGMRTKSDFNHVVGANAFRADLSVAWFTDAEGSVYTNLADDPSDQAAALGVAYGWESIDASTPASAGRPSPQFAGRQTRGVGGVSVGGRSGGSQSN